MYIHTHTIYVYGPHDNNTPDTKPFAQIRRNRKTDVYNIIPLVLTTTTLSCFLRCAGTEEKRKNIPLCQRVHYILVVVCVLLYYIGTIVFVIFRFLHTHTLVIIYARSSVGWYKKDGLKNKFKVIFKWQERGGGKR